MASFFAAHKKGWIAFVVLLVFAVLLVRYLDRVPKRHYCDFRVYHHAAQDFLAGKDLYFRESMDITPFKYSPFFALLVAPLGFLPIKAAAAVFFASFESNALTGQSLNVSHGWSMQ